MPILIAGLLRAAIQFAVTIGIIELAERAILPLINRAIQEVIEAFGIPEDQAKDIVANSWITALEEIGIAAVAIKSKTPTKVAELLGFTSKGFAKRILPQSLINRFPSLAGISGKAVQTIAGNTATAVENIAKSRKVSLDTASKIANLLIAGLGVPIGAGLLLINTIDFAAWPTSAYQDTFQKFFAIFGIEADKEKVSPKVLSDDQFNKAFEVFRLSGAKQINNPYIGQVVPFTRENLLQLLEKIASAILLENGKYTINQVIGASIGYIIKTSAPASPATGSSQLPPATGGQAFVPGKIVAGKAQTFTATPDELVNLALTKVSGFLTGFQNKLDFELTVRNNPLDENGKFQTGKFYAIQILLRTTQFSKVKLAEILLRPLAKDEKPLTSVLEEPFEQALRFAVGSSQSQPIFQSGSTPSSTPTPTPTPEPVLPPPPPAPTPPPAPLTDAQKVQQGLLTAYVRFGYDQLIFARLTGAWVRKTDVPAMTPVYVEERGHNISADYNYRFSNGITFADAYNNNKNAIKTAGLELSYPQYGIGSPAPAPTPPPAPAPAPQPSPAPAPSKPPYVQFAGSPDNFNRQTGQWISPSQAQSLNIFSGGKIESKSTPRPEVRVASDFAVWSQRNLTQYPVP